VAEGLSSAALAAAKTPAAPAPMMRIWLGAMCGFRGNGCLGKRQAASGWREAGRGKRAEGECEGCSGGKPHERSHT
jgi:hypothetical protein